MHLKSHLHKRRSSATLIDAFEFWHLIGCTDCSSCVTICKNKNDYGIKQYPIIPHHILRPSFIAISGCKHSMREQQQCRALAKNESIMRHQNCDRASISAGCASKNERNPKMCTVTTSAKCLASTGRSLTCSVGGITSLAILTQ